MLVSTGGTGTYGDGRGAGVCAGCSCWPAVRSEVALLVAGAEVLLIHYVDPLLSEVVPFLVLIAMLVVRPWGLLGTREELDRV